MLYSFVPDNTCGIVSCVMLFLLHIASVTNLFFHWSDFRLPSKTSRKELSEGCHFVKLWMPTDNYFSLFFQLSSELKLLFGLSFPALGFSSGSWTFFSLQSRKATETVETVREVIFSLNITLLTEFWLKPFVSWCYGDVFVPICVWSLLALLQWSRSFMCTFFFVMNKCNFDTWIVLSVLHCGVGICKCCVQYPTKRWCSVGESLTSDVKLVDQRKFAQINIEACWKHFIDFK